MVHPRYDEDEIARRGKELYAHGIRDRVETEENIGKIISINIETGEFCVDSEILRAAMSLHEARPGAAVWSERIGYDAVYAFGPVSIERTAK